jgi:hypothetical protein
VTSDRWRLTSSFWTSVRSMNAWSPSLYSPIASLGAAAYALCIEVSTSLAGLPLATRCFSLRLFMIAKTKVWRLFPISMCVARGDEKLVDLPREDTASDEDTEHRADTRVVVWGLVRAEQEGPDYVAHS